MVATAWGVNDEGQLGRRIPDGDEESPAVPGVVQLGAAPEEAGKVTPHPTR
jgi:alpha-tubulin suppressor-like RCC1 family protein